MNDTPAPERLLSLDTLRGFDMFWIIGGGGLLTTLADQSGWGWAEGLAAQMHHAKWGSFYFYDLIFPLFIFMAGVTIPYSLYRQQDKGVSNQQIYLKIIRRSLILMILGAIYNGALQFQFDTLRMASVLGLIGVAYGVGACIAINFRSLKALAGWTLGILSGYAILQLFVPVPGHGAGVLTGAGSINGVLDRLLVPGRLLGSTMDPEGFLGSIGASSLTLMGAFAGLLLKQQGRTEQKKAAMLSTSGAVFVLAALTLQSGYPIIKGLWTSTYMLLAGGISLLLLTLFYMVIDVWKFRRGTLFFRVIGMNSITIYMACKLFNFSATSAFLFGGIARLSGEAGPVVLAAGVLVVEWLFLYFLYRKQVFLKI